MSIATRHLDQINPERAHSPVCNNKDCNSSCSYAYGCSEQRMERTHFPWPVLVLGVVAVVALFV
jgi:hypothetical protein